MKFLSVIYAAAVTLLCSFGLVPFSANLNHAQYALAQSSFVQYAYLPSDAALYDFKGTKVCTLPATYFVAVGGSESGGRYPVSYLDLDGFVLSSDVEIVDYEPVTKFPSLTCKPNSDGLPVNLRSAPATSRGEILAAVPHGSILTLYGGISGDEVYAGAGGEWKYVRYDTAQKPIYGYIYAPQLKCDALSPNKIEKVEKKPSKGVNETGSDFSLNSLSATVMAIALCIPAGIIMIAAMHRPDSKRVPRHAPK